MLLQNTKENNTIMIPRKSTNNKGFVALMSAIIISAVLLLLAITTSQSEFYSRFNILDSEIKEQSSSFADACLEVALLGFVQNPSYSGNVIVPVGSDSCFISPVITSGSQKIFVAKGIYLNSHTNLKITLDGATFSVISVEEIPYF